MEKPFQLPGQEQETACQRATALVSQFRSPSQVGQFCDIEASAVPEPFRQLLNHCSHMTVAMERFHGAAVSLEVVKVADQADPGQGSDPFSYVREILLRCPVANPALFPADEDGLPANDPVVQYGVVGIAFDRLPPAVVEDIRRGSRPLGRILIEAGLHREVRDVSLLKLQPGPHLTALFGGSARQPVPTTYGRVATIDVSGKPVLRLLEVVGVPAMTSRR